MVSASTHLNVIQAHARADEELSEEDVEGAPFEARDLADGPVLRFEAYREAWKECLGRIQVRILPMFLILSTDCRQDVIRDIQAPLARRLVHDLKTAYDAPLPGLPYPEIPTFAVCGT